MWKGIAVCTILLGYVFGINAQVKPKHEHKIYQSPEGRLYIQKSLPIYVRMAVSSADTAKTYLLRSETSKKYTNPMYFDVDGFNSFRSPSEVDTVTKKPVFPKQDIIFEVYADSNSPKTKIEFGNSKVYNHKGGNYIKGTTQITLSATDDLSGIENIFYSVDSADYKIYNDPIELNTEKEFVIKYYAADNVGNVDKDHRIVIITDFTSPHTSYTIVGDNFENTLSGKTLIKLSAADGNGSGVAKIIYKIDENNEKLYSSAINTGFLEQGEHTLTYYSVDQVGNRDDEHTYDFYIDRTPPTVMQEINGKSFVANGREYSSGRSQLQITTIDNKAGIKEIFYSINNGPYKRYENPVTLASTSGSLVVKSYAVDNVNNIGYSSENQDRSKGGLPSYIDLNGPSVNYYLNGPVFNYNGSLFISSKTKITLKASDKESGTNHIEYIVNNGESNTYSTPFSLTNEGSVTIQYTAFDNVDNITPGSVNVIVDNTGPEIFVRYSVPSITSENSLEVYPSFVSVFVSATDTQTGFDRMTFKLNNQPEKLFTGFIPVFLKGNNKLVVKAFDKLGNISEKTVEFVIR